MYSGVLMRSGPTQVTAGSADGAAADSGALAMPSAAGCNCKSGSSSAIKPLDTAGAGASGSS